MKRLALFFLISFFGSHISLAQSIDPVYNGIKDPTWRALFKIKYEVVENFDAYGDATIPVFSEEARSLDGAEILLTGYIFPFENALKTSHLMFTALPVNACFFCGVGGPESVVEVFLKSPETYKQGKLKVKGILELNDKNPDSMMYILNNAEIVDE